MGEELDLRSSKEFEVGNRRGMSLLEKKQNFKRIKFKNIS